MDVVLRFLKHHESWGIRAVERDQVRQETRQPIRKLEPVSTPVKPPLLNHHFHSALGSKVRSEFFDLGKILREFGLDPGKRFLVRRLNGMQIRCEISALPIGTLHTNRLARSVEIIGQEPIELKGGEELSKRLEFGDLVGIPIE